MNKTAAKQIVESVSRKVMCSLSSIFYSSETAVHRMVRDCRTCEFRSKCLYASPVGASGKSNLESIIRAFGTANFDYLIFVYDDTRFDEPIFESCRFIREPGLRWNFHKRYVTPEVCRDYDYVFLWADDLVLETFRVDEFLDIMRRNHLEVAQPALSEKSCTSHRITLADPSQRVGRYTDFVEIMVPVFARDAWEKFWRMLDADRNPWGWGYDALARSICGYKFMGIVDSQRVTHARPAGSGSDKAWRDYQAFIARHPKRRMCRQISYLPLR
jgi:hypothetical protein